MPTYPAPANSAVAFGTAGAKPAAASNNAGTAYYATDTGEITFSNGVSWGTINQTSAGTFHVQSGNLTVAGGGGLGISSFNALDVSGAGQGLQVKEGSNCKQGTATLVAGTVTVANTSVTATSRIFITVQSLGGTQGILAVTGRMSGSSWNFDGDPHG